MKRDPPYDPGSPAICIAAGVHPQGTAERELGSENRSSHNPIRLKGKCSDSMA